MGVSDADGRIVRGEVVRDPVARRGEPVQRVSSARMSHTEDVNGRMRRYAFSMAVRTACVAAFVIVFPHWSAWFFLPGAVLLPYVSVILANAGRERSPVAVPVPAHVPPADRMIGGGPARDDAT